MENATDALYIAFAVLVLVIALSVSVTMFSRLNSVSKIVIDSSDTTRYYEYNIADGSKQSRVVGLETIIPNLYKYYNENYTIVFLSNEKNADGTYKPLELYESQTKIELWGDGNTNKGVGTIGKYYSNGIDDNPVCSFDLDEETIRHEPWTGSPEDCKRNIDCFLEGEKFTYYSSHDSLTKSYDYEGFIKKYKGKQFKEMLGEYNYKIRTIDANGYDTIDEEDERSTNYKKKRVIVYQLLDD